MKWVTETLDQRVDDELNALPSALRARLSRIVELIEPVGPGAGPRATHQASGGQAMGNTRQGTGRDCQSDICHCNRETARNPSCFCQESTENA